MQTRKVKKRLQLPFLGSKTVTYADRLLLFTFMLRCHIRSPKGKVQNIISSNSVAGKYLPECWFANPNVHRLLNPGKQPTPALLNRLYQIFLLVELSWRDPIPIVNPLLKTVRIFGGQWDEHSYLVSPNNNKKKVTFVIGLFSLCWHVDNAMKNWKFFGKIIDECSLTLIVCRHWHVFFIT